MRMSFLTDELHVHLCLVLARVVGQHHPVLAALGFVRVLESEAEVLLAQLEIVLRGGHLSPRGVHQLGTDLGFSVLDCEGVGGRRNETHEGG